jgi:peptide/nickel transport system substrate-binding protein
MLTLPRPKALLALMLPIALLLAACGGSGGRDDAATKQFVYLSQSEPARGMDPALASGSLVDGQYMQLVYGQMLYQKADGTIVPGMAQSVTPNADHTQWTVTLRPNLKFSDGTPYDADAVKAYWARMADPATASPTRAPLTEVAEVTAASPTVVQVTLKAPDGTWNQALTTPVGTVPSPTAVKAAGTSYGTTPQTTVGAGPFVITDLSKGNRYVFERNRTYWDAPKPLLDRVEVRAMPDHTARANTFRSGGADMTNSYSAESETVNLQKSGVPTAAVVSPGVFALAMRTDRGPTADVRVREALQRAVDTNAVIQRAAPAAVPAPAVADPKGPWASDVAYPGHDLPKAQRLIDSYLADTGQTTIPITISGANTNTKIWEAVKQEWDKLRGVTVTIQADERNRTSTRIATRDYDTTLSGSLPDNPRTALTNLLTGSPQNLSYLSDPQMDAALREANATEDVAKQKEGMRKVAERASQLVPAVLLYRTPLNWFWQKNVEGVELSLTSGVIQFENVGKGASANQ